MCDNKYKQKHIEDLRKKHIKNIKNVKIKLNNIKP